MIQFASSVVLAILFILTFNQPRGNPPDLGVHAAIGDSITMQRPPCVHIANFGVASDTSRGVLARLDAVIEIRPSRIELMIGVNDISRGISQAETLANVQLIVDRLHASGALVKLLHVLPVSPAYVHPRMTSREMNERITQLNARLLGIRGAVHIRHIPSEEAYQPDGIHLNTREYAELIRRSSSPC